MQAVGTQESTKEAVCSLVGMRTGQRGVVVRIDLDGEDYGRLARLGLCLGNPVAVIREGSPMIVEVLNSRIGLSTHWARHVWLSPER